MKRAQSAGKAPESVQTREGEPGGAERLSLVLPSPFPVLSEKLGKIGLARIYSRVFLFGEKKRMRERGKTVFSFLFIFFFWFFSFFLVFSFSIIRGERKGKKRGAFVICFHFRF